MARALVTLIDYGSGNLRSAAKALERAVREGAMPMEISVTDKPDEVARAERVILPGVGAFADCWDGIIAKDGLMEALAQTAVVRGRPILGICVGMQLFATRGLEHGVHDGLGWIPGEVAAMTPDDPALKIPHMGWNGLESLADHPLLAGIDAGDQAYFVHSYHFRPKNPAHVMATCDHGGRVTAIVGRDTMVGTQFHPEKSQKVGLRLLANFLRWTP